MGPSRKSWSSGPYAGGLPPVWGLQSDPQTAAGHPQTSELCWWHPEGTRLMISLCWALSSPCSVGTRRNTFLFTSRDGSFGRVPTEKEIERHTPGSPSWVGRWRGADVVPKAMTPQTSHAACIITWSCLPRWHPGLTTGLRGPAPTFGPAHRFYAVVPLEVWLSAMASCHGGSRCRFCLLLGTKTSRFPAPEATTLPSCPSKDLLWHIQSDMNFHIKICKLNFFIYVRQLFSVFCILLFYRNTDFRANYMCIRREFLF